MRVLSVTLAVVCAALPVLVPVAAPEAAAAVQDEGRWVEAGRLDAARSGLATVVLEDTLYAAGGAGLTVPRNEFESYDPMLDRWFPETPLPTGLERFGMAVIGDRIYVAGGYAQGELGGVGPSPAMWSWTPQSRVWQSEAAMPAPRADFTLLAHDDKLFAIGGAFDDQTMFVFDSETREWDSLEVPAGVMRASASSVVTGDEILIAGGIGAAGLSSRVDVYSVAEDRWRTAPALPIALSGAAIAQDADGRIRLFGGRGGADNVTLDRHFSWADGETVWREEAALPSPRTNASAARLDSGIYVVGGGSGGGFFAPFTALDSTDVFRQGAD